ncbi:MAG: hypothetical protein FWC06_03195 [Treponema sp.]|nr:hypothetical protein [Treponema sp.]
MKENNKQRKKFRHSYTAYFLLLCLAVSLITLVIYVLEVNYDDSFLYYLLIIMRYSSFMVIVCCFYKILLNLYRIVIKHRKINPIVMIFYFFFLIYGICIFLFEAFIVVISGGNA